MRFRKIIILFFALILTIDLSIAQDPPSKKDSTVLYRKIEDYSRRSRFDAALYKLVFKPTDSLQKKNAVRKKTTENLKQQSYSQFDGKIIRKIDIISLDPFGHSVYDTANQRRNFFFDAGNKIHIGTQGITIRNLLLFRRNRPFNSLLVKESERLIRSQKYVHEVLFLIKPSGINSDSVDITIRELDKWSIIPKGYISSKGFRIGITDKNFLGMGHEFQNIFSRKYLTGISAFNTNYFIPNFRNTYISSKLHYGVDGNQNLIRAISFERPFYSPVTRWAAGISLSSEFRNDSIKDASQLYVPISLKYRTQDYWAGFAKPVFKQRPGNESITNLILSLRFLNINYSEKPSEIIDPLRIYTGEQFYLGSAGISTRKYIQDKYIFKFGVIEEVPAGKVLEFTGGYQVKNNSGRSYFGARVSAGNYNKLGYLSSEFGIGSFFNGSHPEQSVIEAGINYFTGLFEIGNWKFRQFGKVQITIGLNRFSSDSISLNEGSGLEGFNSPVLAGTKRLLFTLQTQSYAPFKLIGFRFGPFLTCSMGMIGDVDGFTSSKVYSQFGLGVLIKNEYLVFNTFQVSISFYPLIPGYGQNVLKMNSFRTTDFGFRDFEIGKPSAIIFQ